MVIETLRSLMRIDYPRLRGHPDRRQHRRRGPLASGAAVVHGNRVKFAHLEDWPGYKSGALNYALRELTDPCAEVIGVVDSDYQIKPGFLRHCAPAVRRPVDRVRPDTAGLPGLAARAVLPAAVLLYKYFFAVSQPSRNEHDGAIFAGTMGLIRRVALDAAGRLGRMVHH